MFVYFQIQILFFKKILFVYLFSFLYCHLRKIIEKKHTFLIIYQESWSLFRFTRTNKSIGGSRMT